MSINPTPVVVSGLSDVTAVSAGSLHTCALKSDHTVHCWGLNYNGQLGNDSTATSYTPVQVQNLTDAVAISAGARHTCAVRSGGGVACWGANSHGELGDGTVTERHTPVTVSGLSGATSVSAGVDGTCAVAGGGSVHCWGRNNHGQVGSGSVSGDELTPVAVSGLTGVAQVSVGFYSVCARRSTGTVACWGFNGSGQLGNGSNSTPVLSPTNVTGLSDATSVSLGSYHACTRRSVGAAHCWGNNLSGKLGDGTNTSSYSPVQVSDLEAVVDVGTGSTFSCALTSDNEVHCWGDNAHGQLGNGGTTTSWTPVRVLGIGIGIG